MQRLEQTTEIFGSVDKHLDTVALRPTRALSASTVDLGCRVTPFSGIQEPIVKLQRPRLPSRTSWIWIIILRQLAGLPPRCNIAASRGYGGELWAGIGQRWMPPVAKMAIAATAMIVAVSQPRILAVLPLA
jgi:hypothetical protein